MTTDVIVIIGAGGIGQAIARRQGAGKLVLLADFNAATMEAGFVTGSDLLMDGGVIAAMRAGRL